MATTEQRLADALRQAIAATDKQAELLKAGVRDIPCPCDEARDAWREALAAYDAQQAETAVTWSPSMNRWRDQTGTAHAYMPDSADPVCGARPYSSGGHYTKAEDSGAHACRRCKRALAAAGVRHA